MEITWELGIAFLRASRTCIPKKKRKKQQQQTNKTKQNKTKQNKNKNKTGGIKY